MGTIFIAGIYGVGKSTLCAKLSEHCGYPYFSASDIISQKNGEQYGANKTVLNKEKNQDILPIMSSPKSLIFRLFFKYLPHKTEPKV